MVKQLIPFLDTLEQIHLQTLNPFWYNIAVSRVQTVIPTKVLYFAWSESGQYRETIFQINAATLDPFTFRDDKLNFSSFYTVMVGRGLYAFEQNVANPRFRHYSQLHVGHVKVEELAQPSLPRNAPSLANYNDEKIFVTGGSIPNKYSKIHKECAMYDIKEGKWYNEMPTLLIGRSNHSSCCLGKYLYVCGGYSKNRSFMLDIEFLRLDILDQTSRW